MQVNDKLREQIAKAVEISMRIEGYAPVRSKPIKDKARQLMERQGVQVSLQRQ
jgi:hypothetical protein